MVKESPEVRQVASQTGRNDDGTDPYGPNRNELFVALTPYDTWARGVRKSDLIETLNTRLRSSVPGAFFSFTQPIIDNVTEAVTGSPADLAVIVTGSDLRELRRLGGETLAVPARGAGPPAPATGRGGGRTRRGARTDPQRVSGSGSTAAGV